ncbi:hypothetical protein BDN71DRAFT_1441670 [Pleurotus eryngii]|uniref:Chromo domain-containing protein n=1 Tax=Pleurotus eryngii TaxID=5323 RepID=A0A9P6A5E0_PLEER|nr:hypothetical protein BDN71DRAFT_1441670 [Pleurotus eryngii]
MARAASVADSDDQPIAETGTDNEAGNEETPGSEGEEEYEIEEIIEAKKGMFSGGRVGYLVKWKGYSSEHNSWVDERDAGNAADLIDTFWKKQNAAKARRKSGASESASRAPARDWQKSNLSGDESAVTTTKKRGRTSKAADAEGDTRTTKKAKKPANGKAQTVADAKDNDDISVGNMNQYTDMPDWEPLIQSVDTVCSTEEGLLEVFFTLNSGERVKEASKICKERFPNKLIDFYEAHLKWRSVDSS